MSISAPPRYPKNDVQRTRSICEDVPLFQDPFSGDTITMVNNSFNGERALTVPFRP